MRYESLLNDFLRDEQNRRYSANIIDKLTFQHKLGLINQIRRERGFAERIQEVIEFLVNDAINKKRYTASILPTIVSPNQAPNFWFRDEKEPTREEVYRLLYMLLTGLYHGNCVVNLDNVDASILNEFRNSLVKKSIIREYEAFIGIDVKKMFQELDIRRFPLTEFGFSLLILSHFASWLRDRASKIYPDHMQKIKEMGLPNVLSEMGVEETITLVTCNILRQKKEMYITPRLKDFVVKWYEDFMAEKQSSPCILSFLSSLYVNHKDYREMSEKLMNKFIYYLLRGYVNGELLVDMINFKTRFELKEKARCPFPLYKANEFLAKIG